MNLVMNLNYKIVKAVNKVVLSLGKMKKMNKLVWRELIVFKLDKLKKIDLRVVKNL